MSKLAFASPHFDEPACPNCGSTETSSRMESQVFEYGAGTDAAMLTASVPQITCATCGFVFTDFRAEEARHDAVCLHVGVLSPRQIRAIRSSYEMGQSEFADLTGIGRASMGRWESGQLIQNRSTDNLLFLLSFPENLNKLRRRAGAKEERKSGHVKSEAGKFRVLTSQDVEILQIEADCFDPFAVYPEGLACT